MLQTNIIKNDMEKGLLVPDMAAAFRRKATSQNSIVYIVDDDFDDRLFAYTMLRRSERVAEVRPVKCAESLFKCLESAGIYDSAMLGYTPSIILLDINMPGLNGIETLERIRSHPATGEIPVILLSSDLSCERVYDAYRLHANGFLEKPLDLEKFHYVLDTGWNGSSAGPEHSNRH